MLTIGKGVIFLEREQFKTLVKGMKAVYSDPKFIADKDAFDVWYSLLQDLDYDMASQAVQKYMMSNRFPPTISDIREQCNDFTTPQELNEMEAWSLVSKAIRNSGYNSVEEFEKLPPIVQKAVGIPSQLRTWALDENYNEEVAMSSFQRAYKAELKRHEELQKMPQNVRNLIEKANEGSYSAQISIKRRQAIESVKERRQGEIKALEMKNEGVPMPEKYKERLEDMRNG